MTNINSQNFKKFIEKLEEIRSLMKQKTITCEFKGGRFLIVNEEMPMEYMGPEFEIGSTDIFPESHKDPEINGIFEILLNSEIVAIRKSY